MTTPTKPDRNIFVDPRNRLINWVRKQLTGPIDLEENDAPLRGFLPTERFPVGALYPTSPFGEGIDPATEDGADDDTSPFGAGEKLDEPAVVRRYTPPSSLGFSFFIKGDAIHLQVLCSAAQYEQVERDEDGRFKKEWAYKPLSSGARQNEEFLNVVCPSNNSRQSYDRFNGKARIDVVWRQFADGWIVTISLCNTRSLKFEQKNARDFSSERASMTLFEASLQCVIDAGEVGTYPRVDRSLLDEEEQEIELQYSHRHVYAIGHGCAANWGMNENGKVIEVYSETMPAVEVPQMTSDTGTSHNSVLSIARLSSIDSQHTSIEPELTSFVNDYEDWVLKQAECISEQSMDDSDAAKRIVDRMKIAVSRMRTGLNLLKNDNVVRLAFSIANRAMLNQMQQHDCLQNPHKSEVTYRWRPFQLAFMLTTLESVANRDSDFRDILDLIWFPTGGGKTEAYFGLIAFQIALRRLHYPDTGGGTAVLMRYTLRLLTRDQFMRATRLICALELIRRERTDLGKEEITVGLWVGDSTSPNTFKDAADIVSKARTAGGKPALVLNHCPWCGDTFSANRNFHCTDSHFHFLCTNEVCAFGSSSNQRLPCNVVDQALYANPPTMLVATVDKFARLAWEEDSNAFFGGTRNLPPELIIQDELHLIASALGSIAGLYEAAIDTVVQSRGVHPKYIASTATIRMAKQQVKSLYGRDVVIFPPPGVSCDDSFFAKTVDLEDRPGRMYVGYLAPMLNRQECMAPLAAALLLAPNTLFTNEQNQSVLLDAWWTQMVYHGSLKGVSNSHTAFASTVRNSMQLLEPQARHGNRVTPGIAQLTSLQTAEQNADIFARLNRKCGVDGCLDAVLATNMISVGLDVGRLGLMIINGQPLTTAEYIQASSRVGRSDVPGLVFVNYYRDQARSLSHYESFRPYHDAFYRYVEPTSVTPYTYQARLRALHAALVIVIRHAGIGMLSNESAGDFDFNNPSIIKAVNRLKSRCKQSISDHSNVLDEHIDNLISQWQDEVERCRLSRRALNYQVPDKDIGRDRLLYNHDSQILGLWPTLQSLRHVENSALLKAL